MENYSKALLVLTVLIMQFNRGPQTDMQQQSSRPLGVKERAQGAEAAVRGRGVLRDLRVRAIQTDVSKASS